MGVQWREYIWGWGYKDVIKEKKRRRKKIEGIL
jgi:hypothetical protein